MSLSRVQLFVYLETVSCQAPLSKDSPGRNTGVGDYSLLQGIFQNQGLNQGVLQIDGFLPAEPHGNPTLVETAWWTQETEAQSRPGRPLPGWANSFLGCRRGNGKSHHGNNPVSAVLGSISVQARKVRGLDGGFSGGAGICGG